MMSRGRSQKLAALLAAWALAVACNADGNPPMPSSPSVNPPSNLAGSYHLTMTLSDQCTDVPETARQRVYQATLEATTYRYLSIRVTGGGYSVPIGIGDVWPDTDTRVRIVWNMFDIRCGDDGYFEPLPDGTSMMVCGTGFGVTDEMRILATLAGDVVIWDRSGQRRVCAGTHQFTFTRGTR